MIKTKKVYKETLNILMNENIRIKDMNK